MSLPLQIRSLADQGASADEISDTLGVERVYVRMQLGLDITEEDGTKAAEVIKGIAFSPFSKDSDKIAAAKWVYDTRHGSKARASAHAAVSVNVGNIQISIGEATNRFFEQARRMMANESNSQGAGGAEEVGAGRDLPNRDGEPVHAADSAQAQPAPITN